MTNNSSCVAVTGATGFIGRSVMRQLKEQGINLRALVRTPRSDPDVTYVQGDLKSLDALETLCSGADVFLHIAGLTKALRSEDLLDVNECGAVNAARAAKTAGMRRFILVSSITAREPHLSPYAYSKRAGEIAVRDVLQGTRSPELIIVRPPAIVGPDDEATAPMLNILRRGFLPAPAGKVRLSGRMSFVYMDDIARFLIEQIGSSPSLDVLTPCGATPQTSWQDLADSAARVLSKPVRVIPISPLILTASALISQTGCGLFRRSSFFNAGKVRELLHTDWTGDVAIANSYTLDQALRLAFGMDNDI